VSPPIRKRGLGLSNSLAGGVFLSTGFLDLLAESQMQLEEVFGRSFPFSLTLACFGFLAPFIFERVFLAETHHHIHSHVHESDEGKVLLLDDNEVNAPSVNHKRKGYQSTVISRAIKRSKPHKLPKWVPYILMIVVCIHTAIAGMTFGLLTEENKILSSLVITLAHKWVEAFAIGTSLARFKIKTRKFYLLLFVFISAEPFGIFVGTLVSLFLNQTYLLAISGIAGSMAAGTFIYVATIDIMASEFARLQDKYPKLGVFVFGFILSTVVRFTVPLAFEEGQPDVE